jgi:predicted outer membrane repeat protein
MEVVMISRLASRNLIRFGLAGIGCAVRGHVARLALALALTFGAFHVPGVATTAFAIDVSSTADAPKDPAGGQLSCLSTNGQCTLRSTIQAFNASGSGPFTLNLTTPGVYDLTLGDGGEDGRLDFNGAVGDLDITSHIIINNTSGGTVRIRGSFGYRVFHVQTGKRLELYNLAVENGHAISGGGGGGIYNNGGTVIATGVTFEDNHTTAFGGGIHAVNGATVQVTNARFIHNTSEAGGGAIAGSGGQTISVTGSRFQINYVVNNPTLQLGGAIYSLDKLTIRDSDFVSNGLLYNNPVGNTVLQGGALYLNGTASITNSTFAHNAAQADPNLAGTARGGGIYVGDGANVKINASTIARNAAKTSGGGIDRGEAPNTVVSLVNTIVAHNTAGQTPFGNCRIALASGGYNLEADVETAYNCGLFQDTDKLATDAKLAAQAE